MQPQHFESRANLFSLIFICIASDELITILSNLFTMAAIIERDPNRVYFRAGGFEQSRPILNGSDAKDSFEFIPIIDTTDIFSPDLEVRKKLAAEIGRAVKDVGFFYAVNPPVSTNLMGE